MSEQLNMTNKPAVLVVGEGLDEACKICAILRAAGCEVCYVSSFEDGVGCLDHQFIDFVIISQGTRFFEGRSVLVRAIEKDRHLPVLVVTHSVDMSIYLEAMQLGALDYLEEPAIDGQILELVASHTYDHAHSAQWQGF